MTQPAADTPNAPPSDSWTVSRILEWTTNFLKERGCESPRVDAEILMSHAWKCDRILLYTRHKDEAPAAVREQMRALVKRRAQREPIAYLVGHKEFYSLRFAVSRDVLVPRPETETLVAEAIRFLQSRSEPLPSDADGDAASVPFGTEDDLRDQPTGGGCPNPKVADLGTGSGCIAVTLAKRCPTATVDAVDLSPEAASLAERNASIHGVQDRVAVHVGDLFGPLGDRKYDLIVSNPPYVRSDEMPTLQEDVRDHEPTLALDGGRDGLNVLRRIVDGAAKRLNPGGSMMVELDPAQMADAERILSAAGFKGSRVVKDANQDQRVIVATIG